MSESENIIPVPVDLIRRLLHWADVGWDGQREFAEPDDEEDYKSASREAEAILAKAPEADSDLADAVKVIKELLTNMKRWKPTDQATKYFYSLAVQNAAAVLERAAERKAES